MTIVCFSMSLAAYKPRPYKKTHCDLEFCNKFTLTARCSPCPKPGTAGNHKEPMAQEERSSRGKKAVLEHRTQLHVQFLRCKKMYWKVFLIPLTPDQAKTVNSLKNKASLTRLEKPSRNTTAQLSPT